MISSPLQYTNRYQQRATGATGSNGKWKNAERAMRVSARVCTDDLSCDSDCHGLSSPKTGCRFTLSFNGTICKKPANHRRIFTYLACTIKGRNNQCQQQKWGEGRLEDSVGNAVTSQAATEKKQGCYSPPYSPALLSAQALSDLEIVLKCVMHRFSEEIAGAASMGAQFLLYTILCRSATGGRGN